MGDRHARTHTAASTHAYSSQHAHTAVSTHAHSSQHAHTAVSKRAGMRWQALISKWQACTSRGRHAGAGKK